MAEYRHNDLRFNISGGVIASSNTAQFTWVVYVADGGAMSHDKYWAVKINGSTLVTDITKLNQANYEGTLVSSSAFHIYKGRYTFTTNGDEHGLFNPLKIELTCCDGSSKSFTYDFGDNLQYRAYFGEFSDFNDAQIPSFTYGAYGYEGIEEIRLINTDGIIGDKKPPVPTNTELLSYTFELTAEEKKALYDIVAEQTNSWTYLKFQLRTKFADGKILLTEGNVYVRFSVTDNAPTLAPEIVDTNAATLTLTGDSSVLVRYWSNAQVTPNAEGTKGNSIVDFGFQNGTETYKNYETINLEKVEFNEFDFYAIDNKNQVVKQTVITPFIPYVKLNARITSGAPSGEGEMNLIVKGSFYCDSFGVVDNELSVYYRVKLKSDEEYGDWVQFTDITINKHNHTYVAKAYLTGLNYQETYVCQSKAVDALDTVLSTEKDIATTPIFDWSNADFNFNVPVTIMGGQAATLNDIIQKEEVEEAFENTKAELAAITQKLEIALNNREDVPATGNTNKSSDNFTNLSATLCGNTLSVSIEVEGGSLWQNYTCPYTYGTIHLDTDKIEWVNEASALGVDGYTPNSLWRLQPAAEDNLKLYLVMVSRAPTGLGATIRVDMPVGLNFDKFIEEATE